MLPEPLSEILDDYVNTAERKEAVDAIVNSLKNASDVNAYIKGNRVTTLRTNAQKMATDIQTKEQEIATYTAIISSLPDGDIKDDFITKKTLAEQDLYRLNLRFAKLNGRAILISAISAVNAQSQSTLYSDILTYLSNMDV